MIIVPNISPHLYGMGQKWLKKNKKKHHINAVDQKTDSTEHLLFWSAAVIWSMCLFVCHMVGRQRGMRVGGRGLLFDLVASKWGRPSKAGHQHRDQTCLSRSNHPQGHRRTRVKPPAGRKSMHMSLQAALVNTGFPLRCESDLQLQALSLVLSTTKKKKKSQG